MKVLMTVVRMERRKLIVREVEGTERIGNPLG
jgi:hypothetical protein